uniref:Uncharacterized protein n=1 Tax=Ditylenchus dipsaci TaxID=166011 RepID=A0A915CMV1_9BILA
MKITVGNAAQLQCSARLNPPAYLFLRCATERWIVRTRVTNWDVLAKTVPVIGLPFVWDSTTLALPSVFIVGLSAIMQLIVQVERTKKSVQAAALPSSLPFDSPCQSVQMSACVRCLTNAKACVPSGARPAISSATNP